MTLMRRLSTSTDTRGRMNPSVKVRFKTSHRKTSDRFSDVLVFSVISEKRCGGPQSCVLSLLVLHSPVCCCVSGRWGSHDEPRKKCLRLGKAPARTERCGAQGSPVAALSWHDTTVQEQPSARSEWSCQGFSHVELCGRSMCDRTDLHV